VLAPTTILFTKIKLATRLPTPLAKTEMYPTNDDVVAKHTNIKKLVAT
jgi:hypothetical protein